MNCGDIGLAMAEWKQPENKISYLDAGQACSNFDTNYWWEYVTTRTGVVPSILVVLVTTVVIIARMEICQIPRQN